MGYTYDQWVAGGGLAVGTTGGIPVASSSGQLYQLGTAITVSATQINALVATGGAQTITDKTLSAGTVCTVETVTSTSQTALNYGVSNIYSTQIASSATFLIAAPSSGVQKTIRIMTGTCTGLIIIRGATDTINFIGSTNYVTNYTTNVLYMSNKEAQLSLVGLGTTSWLVVGALGAVASTA